MGVTAADAVAVLGACSRVAAEIAGYYGDDVDVPHEKLFAAGVIGVGLTSQAGKVAAYEELNRLVHALARKKTRQVLDKNLATEVIRAVYLSFSARLTKEKLGQAVPVLGIVVVGAGLNARTLSNAADAAEHAYRERFLRAKYGILADLPHAHERRADVVDITEILEATIDREDEAQ